MKLRNYLFSAFPLILFGLLSSKCQAEVAELTDATFEHETQASTGMTTGSWFVLFSAKRCKHCMQAAPEFEKLANDEELAEKGIVLGRIDEPTNRQTTVRFKVHGIPYLLFLHKGQAYRYHGQRTFGAMKKYLMEHDGTGGENIPPPPSFVTQMLMTAEAIWFESYRAAQGKSGSAGIAMIVLLVVGLLIVMGILSLCFLPAKNVDMKKQS